MSRKVSRRVVRPTLCSAKNDPALRGLDLPWIGCLAPVNPTTPPASCDQAAFGKVQTADLLGVRVF